MVVVGIFYGHWFILRPFGIFCGHLVYFMVYLVHIFVLVWCTKKNLATMLRTTPGSLFSLSKLQLFQSENCRPADRSSR
jgi:hypothetical protein